MLLYIVLHVSASDSNKYYYYIITGKIASKIVKSPQNW